MFCLCLVNFIYAQVDTNWVFTFDGGSEGNDRADDIMYAPDGNIYVSGIFDNGPNDDIGILSLTPAGDTNWTFEYNGPNNGNEKGPVRLCCGEDGTIYAAGLVRGSDYDIGVFSLTPAGDTNWVYLYDGPNSGNEKGPLDICCGADGNIYVTGIVKAATDDIGILSLTPAGDTNWTFLYDGPENGNEAMPVLACAPDSTVYIAGVVNAVTDDIIVLHLTGLGDTSWTYLYDGPGSGNEAVADIIIGSDGNIYITGTAAVVSNDVLLLCMTTSGDTSWSFLYNGAADGDDEGTGSVFGSDGNVYVSGTVSNGTNNDILVLSYQPGVDTNWTFVYNGPSNNEDWSNDIVFADGYAYVTGVIGFSNRDFGIFCINALGDTAWTFLHDGTNVASDEGRAIVYASGGTVYAAGYSKNTGTAEDITVISLTNTTAVCEHERTAGSPFLFTVIPNPFTGSAQITYTIPGVAHITLTVYDVAGRNVQTLIDGVLQNGINTVKWDGTDESGKKLSSGVYFLELRCDGARTAAEKVTVYR